MPKLPFVCTVDQVRLLSPNVTEVSFRANKLFHFVPGQYLNIHLPQVKEGSGQRGNYSFSSPPQARQMEICFEKVGPLSKALGDLKPGDTFRAQGPYGRFIYDTDATRHFCYVSTGSGIGPFRSLVLSPGFQNRLPLSTTCIQEAESSLGLLYRNDIENLSFVRFIPAVENEKAADAILKFQNFPWAETDFYLCGDAAMIREVKSILSYFGVVSSQITEESYFDSSSTLGKVA